MKNGIYIAGPMTGLPEFNYPAFFDAEERLCDKGWWENIGNPARMSVDEGIDTKGLTGTESPESFGFDLAKTLTMDLAWIADEAVAIALLPGWETSRGAKVEVALAEALGLEVRPVEDFIFEEGQRVYVKPNAKRYDGSPVVFMAGQTYIVDTGMDGELELFVLDDDYDECGYVRIQDVLPEAPEPKGTVAALHKALTSFAEVEDVLPGGEVRVTSATGGQKGKKAAELGTVDPLALLVLAEVSGFGAQKYDAFNYLKGYDWSLSFNALTRHLLAFWNGEDNDPESGLPHITHAAWHALALTSFQKRDLGTDDRYKKEAA